MAPRIENEEAQEGGRIPTKEEFVKVMKRANSITAEMDGKRGDLGSLIQKAEDSLNLHRKAFKQVRSLSRNDPSKLREFLLHFDAYREHAELDRIAGEDLLETRAEGGKRARGKGRGDTKSKAKKAAGEGEITGTAENVHPIRKAEQPKEEVEEVA